MSKTPARPAPIVKIGGSLFGAPELGALLDVAARHGALVVAGGGLFSDAVRIAQRELGFDDPAAHRMAILAMEQGACLLAASRQDFARCSTREDMAAAAEARQPAIWSPSALAFGADVPASWDVTSDSLALWLAIETGADRVVLVKSAAVPDGGDARSWTATGLVDGFLPTLAARYDGALRCVGDASASALDAALVRSARIAA